MGISVFAVDRAYDDQTLQALIKMEVACRIGLESLPQLPKESEDALREPIETLCRTTAARSRAPEPRLQTQARLAACRALEAARGLPHPAP